MKNQLKTVNEIAKLTGITIRTLHYYDGIDLLKPSEGGYRLYSNKMNEKASKVRVIST